MLVETEQTGNRHLALVSASTTAKIYIYPIAELEKDSITPNI